MNNLVTIIYSLVFAVALANAAPAPEANNSCVLDSSFSTSIPKFYNFFCGTPFFVWVVAIFAILSMAVAAIAKFTDNLQKITDFIKNNFTRKNS